MEHQVPHGSWEDFISLVISVGTALSISIKTGQKVCCRVLCKVLTSKLEHKRKQYSPYK